MSEDQEQKGKDAEKSETNVALGDLLSCLSCCLSLTAAAAAVAVLQQQQEQEQYVREFRVQR